MQNIQTQQNIVFDRHPARDDSLLWRYAHLQGQSRTPPVVWLRSRHDPKFRSVGVAGEFCLRMFHLDDFGNPVIVLFHDTPVGSSPPTRFQYEHPQYPLVLLSHVEASNLHSQHRRTDPVIRLPSAECRTYPSRPCTEALSPVESPSDAVS